LLWHALAEVLWQRRRRVGLVLGHCLTKQIDSPSAIIFGKIVCTAGVRLRSVPSASLAVVSRRVPSGGARLRSHRADMSPDQRGTSQAMATLTSY
jgi:hypothetical protein